jgi:hypothetical protein
MPFIVPDFLGVDRGGCVRRLPPTWCSWFETSMTDPRVLRAPLAVAKDGDVYW